MLRASNDLLTYLSSFSIPPTHPASLSNIFQGDSEQGFSDLEARLTQTFSSLLDRTRWAELGVCTQYFKIAISPWRNIAILRLTFGLWHKAHLVIALQFLIYLCNNLPLLNLYINNIHFSLTILDVHNCVMLSRHSDPMHFPCTYSILGLWKS